MHDRAQEYPVEPAAEDGRGADYLAGIGVESVEPAENRFRERRGDARARQVGRIPAAVALGQNPAADEPGQDLLDQEGNALCPPSDQ